MSDRFEKAPVACVMGDMDLIRPLGLVGVSCASTADRASPLSRSRFVKTALSCPDAGTNEAGLLEALIRFAASCEVRPVLFYQQDAQLLFISRHRDRLASAFRFVIAEAGLVEDVVDKARFQALAERLGLPVPQARCVSASGLGPESLDLRFPVVVKPLTRGAAWDEGFGSAKALDVQTPEALRALWPSLSGARMELLIQEAVPGSETRIESYHVYVNDQGKIAAEFTGRKIRTWPLTFGHSTALTITDAPDVAALGRSIVETLGLRGVAKFDFKRGPDGRLHLLEVNPRFNLWHHLGAVAGVNIPALVYADLVGVPGRAPGRARAGACWCSGLGDYRAARASGVSALSWAAWAMRCEAKSSLAWDDPLPFINGKLSRWFVRFGAGAPPPRVSASKP